MMTGLRLALTPGEPAGIGPDLCIQLAQQPQQHQLVALADPELLRERAQQLGLPLTIELFNPDEPVRPMPARTLLVEPFQLRAPVTTGELNKANSEYVVNTLRAATEGCLKGRYDALITAPVHKGIINDAGIPFSGHTELLEELTNTHKVVMLLATEGLKVALVTTHLPLREVADALSEELLEDVVSVLDAELRHSFGIDSPRILIAGLNPHAGEGGHLGREEIEIINPTLERMRDRGLNLVGPLPADTLFNEHYLNQADAVLAMYHDQGLPVLKFKGFGKAANITLGMPIIRTSVDHGTALDLAGSGKADHGSLQTAIDYAATMASHRKTSS